MNGWLLAIVAGLLVLRPTRHALATTLTRLTHALLDLASAPVTITLLAGWLLVRVPLAVWPWKLAGLAALGWWLYHRTTHPTTRPAPAGPPSVHDDHHPTGWAATARLDAEPVDTPPSSPTTRARASKPAAPRRGASVARRHTRPAGPAAGSGWWQVAATAVWPDCTREVTAEFPLGPTPPTPQALTELEQRLAAWADVQIPGCSYATVTGWWPLAGAPTNRPAP